jgi:hypothetical protein
VRLSKPQYDYAVDCWTAWADWRQRGGWDYSPHHDRDRSELGFAGRPIKDAYTHSDPVVARLIALQGCDRDILTDAVYRDLPHWHARVIWLRYIGLPFELRHTDKSHGVRRFAALGFPQIVDLLRLDGRPGENIARVRRMHMAACEHLVTAKRAANAMDARLRECLSLA